MDRKKLPFAEYSVVKDHPRRSLARKLVGARVVQRQAPLTRPEAPRGAETLQPGLPIRLRASRFGGQASPGLPAVARASERRLVENTGLEPVTSWLQTRRSPS